MRTRGQKKKNHGRDEASQTSDHVENAACHHDGGNRAIERWAGNVFLIASFFGVVNGILADYSLMMLSFPAVCLVLSCLALASSHQSGEAVNRGSASRGTPA